MLNHSPCYHNRCKNSFGLIYGPGEVEKQNVLTVKFKLVITALNLSYGSEVYRKNIVLLDCHIKTYLT